MEESNVKKFNIKVNGTAFEVEVEEVKAAPVVKAAAAPAVTAKSAAKAPAKAAAAPKAVTAPKGRTAFSLPAWEFPDYGQPPSAYPVSPVVWRRLRSPAMAIRPASQHPAPTGPNPRQTAPRGAGCGRSHCHSACLWRGSRGCSPSTPARGGRGPWGTS